MPRNAGRSWTPSGSSPDSQSSGPRSKPAGEPHRVGADAGDRGVDLRVPVPALEVHDEHPDHCLAGHRLLDVAKEHSFAVPAFNISDWAMFVGIMDISEAKAAPVIIATDGQTVAVGALLAQRAFRARLVV